jgi:Flp pilus assembly pilin Flp
VSGSATGNRGTSGEQMHHWRRFWREDDGQDLVEYALLTALIGLVGVTVWSTLVDRLEYNYGQYDSGVQGLWESPAP